MTAKALNNWYKRIYLHDILPLDTISKLNLHLPGKTTP